MNTRKFFSIALILLTISSVVFFLALFSSVRSESDDMIMSLHFRDNSLFRILVNRYNQESFRPLYPILSFFTMGYSRDANLFPYTIFAYDLILWNLFVFATYKLLRELFSLTKNVFVVCFAQLFFTAIYFLTTDRIEIFGWASAAIIHLTPVVFIFISVWLIIKKNARKLDYVSLFLTAFFATAGAEHIALTVIATLVFILLTLWFSQKNRKIFFEENKSAIKKSVYFLIVTTVFFTLFITNKGLWTRYNNAYTYTAQHTDVYYLNFLDVLKMFCKPYKLVGLAFLVSLCFLFQRTFLRESKVKVRLKYFLIASACATLITALISLKVYNTLNMDRIWFAFDVALFALLAAVFLKYAGRINIHITAIKTAIMILIVLMIANDVRHVPALINFSTKHDKIIQGLQYKHENELVVIQEFPTPDLTNQVELSHDPDDPENQLFCRFYNIKAKVSVKK